MATRTRTVSPKGELKEWEPQYQDTMLATTEIQVDPSYQRLETALAIYISESFDPLAFGHLIVARRPRKQYFAVDGQQRLKAARLMNFSSVPCLMFPSDGKTTEARLFKQINQYRKRVTKMEIFRAAITAKSKTALDILKIVRQAGFDIYLKDRQLPPFGFPYLSCVGVLEKVYLYRNGAKRLHAALTTAYELWPGQDDTCRNELVGGVDLFLHGIANFSLSRMKNRIQGKVAAEIIQRADIWKAKQRQGAGFARSEAVAHVLTSIYNSRAK